MFVGTCHRFGRVKYGQVSTSVCILEGSARNLSNLDVIMTHWQHGERRLVLRKRCEGPEPPYHVTVDRCRPPPATMHYDTIACSVLCTCIGVMVSHS